VRRSSAETRRAIQFDHQERDECHMAGARSLVQDERADVLRWAAGDSGTHYERAMRQRNTADVTMMPANKVAS
jgi:hypothetical protein